MPRLHGILADYADPVRSGTGGTGSIDVGATINILQAAHINTYAYLLIKGRSQIDWASLPTFLDAANTAGISVWVYLTPPSEISGTTTGTTSVTTYPPYEEDYIAWADQIATLSISHPNLKAFVMDDFKSNLDVFTPSYVQQMMDGAHSINPALAFWPILYYDDIAVGGKTLIPAYQNVIDGAIFPYLDYPIKNTTNSDDIVAQIKAAHAICSQQVDLPSDSGKFACYQLSFPGNVALNAGDYSEISQQVTFSTSNPVLSFWVWDDYTGNTSGAVYKELLVDGAVAWQEDVVSGNEGPLGWHAVSVNLPGAPGSSHSISLRVFAIADQASFPINVRFDEVQSSGISLSNGDFEDDNSSAWKFAQHSSSSAAPWAGGDISSRRRAYEIAYPWGKTTAASDYAQISEMVTFLTANPTIAFSDWDDYTGPTAGYHFKQLVLDNTVIWEEDVAGGDYATHQVPPQVLPGAFNSTHTLAFRVFDKKGVGNYGIRTRFSNILAGGVQVTNPNFSGSNGWSYSQYAQAGSGSWIGNYLTLANLPLVPMIYCKKYQDKTPPTASYVGATGTNAINMEAQGYDDGVMMYCLPLTSGTDATYLAVKNLYTSWTPGLTAQAMVSLPWGQGSSPGDYGQISKTATIDANAGDYTLGFWLKDDFVGVTAGYHYKQLLVNGEVVWEEDVANNEFNTSAGMVSNGSWQYVFVDLTQQLQGLPYASISWRVYDKKGVGNFGVNVRFDQAASTGFTLSDPGFDTGLWTAGELGNFSISNPAGSP